VPRGACVIEYRGTKGIVYRVKFEDADGRQVQETIGAERDGVTRKQAEAELRERLVRVDRKHYRRPKPVTFGDWSLTWLDDGQRKRAWRPGTLYVYRNVVRHLDDYFGSTRLASIRPRDVAGYVNHHLTEPHTRLRRPMTAKTIELHLSILSDIFKSAIRDELIDHNPAATVERPKVRRRRWRILEPEEARRVSKAFTAERARAVFLTLTLTGIRRGEICALRWRDVSLTEGTLRVSVSKSEEGLRVIQMPPLLIDTLTAQYQRTPYKADSDYVFAHPEKGTTLHGGWYAERFREALARAGIEGHIRPFHDMRHTALTNLALIPEASELVLMATAGHRSFATTRQYLQLAGRVFPDAAAGLQNRMYGGTTLYPPEPTPDDLSEANPALQATEELS
jgi:integrase